MLCTHRWRKSFVSHVKDGGNERRIPQDDHGSQGNCKIRQHQPVKNYP